MKCKECKWKKGKVTTTLRIAGQSVLVQDAPAVICQKCGQFAINGKYTLELEKKLLNQQPIAA